MMLSTLENLIYWVKHLHWHHTPSNIWGDHCLLVFLQVLKEADTKMGLRMKRLIIETFLERKLRRSSGEWGSHQTMTRVWLRWRREERRLSGKCLWMMCYLKKVLAKLAESLWAKVTGQSSPTSCRNVPASPRRGPATLSLWLVMPMWWWMSDSMTGTLGQLHSMQWEIWEAHSHGHRILFYR